MSLVTDALSDLDTMLDDWDDSITIAGIDYAGIYDQEYIESLNASGYTPVFHGRAADLESVVRGTSVAITSPLHSLSAAAFTVAVNQGNVGGLVTLLLEKA